MPEAAKRPEASHSVGKILLEIVRPPVFEDMVSLFLSLNLDLGEKE